MNGEANNEHPGWGLPASVIVHALIAALVIFGLPLPLPQPQEEQAVSVTLEPPPEPPEQAKAASMPPPPAAEPAKPPQPAREKAAAAPVPTLDPVVKFGERDAGPREALDGSAAEDNSAPPTRSAIADENKVTDEATPENPDEDEAAETENAEGKDRADSKAGESTDELVATAAKALDKAAPPLPKPRPAKTAEPSEPRLHEARTLFSRSATGGPAATTAMASIPRGVRVGRLCATELRLQLLSGGHFPDLLPSYELKDGTVLKVRRSAFRAGGVWHNLSFECQVDPDATSVESFAFRVGEPLSREETKRRGLPSQ